MVFWLETWGFLHPALPCPSAKVAASGAQGQKIKETGLNPLGWGGLLNVEEVSLSSEFFLKNKLFGVYLIYGVMLVSAVKQSESVTRIHTPLFWTSSPFRSPQSIGQSSLCKTVGSV